MMQFSFCSEQPVYCLSEMRLLLPLISLAAAKQLNAFDNSNGGHTVLGREEEVTDFLYLPPGQQELPLPAQFTICSSALLTFTPSVVSFFQLYQAGPDRLPWLSLFLSYSPVRQQEGGFRFDPPPGLILGGEQARPRYYIAYHTDRNFADEERL